MGNQAIYALTRIFAEIFQRKLVPLKQAFEASQGNKRILATFNCVPKIPLRQVETEMAKWPNVSRRDKSCYRTDLVLNTFRPANSGTRNNKIP